jgi:pimeloyl-ACP methyl ester carboxylesterase
MNSTWTAVILIGTSMGGLMSMLMANMQPERFAGIVLNDIGPELDPAGLDRIKGYVGKRPRDTHLG